MVLLDPNDISFPDPFQYHPKDGLMAVGGDLSPKRVYFAYQTGLFPWYNEGDEILWWCPDPRFILIPKDVKISKSMQKVLNKEEFRFTKNQCFEKVMIACQDIERHDQDGTWINKDLIKSFVTLHQHGLAHSFEVWKDEELVGGFYGVQVGRIFCGESMFAKVSNASKAGFINFCTTHYAEFDLIDCQVHTEHLESLGAKMISKLDYLNLLKEQS